MAYIYFGPKQVGMGGAFMPGDDLETDFRQGWPGMACPFQEP